MSQYDKYSREDLEKGIDRLLQVNKGLDGANKVLQSEVANLTAKLQAYHAKDIGNAWVELKASTNDMNHVIKILNRMIPA